ncbi:MAG: hypothetical protein JW869_04085 [Candidatus Omnitrophica bacterium]|nr:hypothetical protein [Candidatus Omnitrophota bacterium]
MKRLFLAGAVTFVVICAGCSVPDQVLIDSFEGELNSETVDFGSSADSSLEIYAEKQLKTCGDQAIKLTYQLHPKGYMWCARGYNLDVKGAARWLLKPQKVRWNAYQALALSMYGAKSGAMIALDVKDAGGEIWRFLLNDDFEGWREIACPFNKFFVRTDWQPQTAQKNDILDFPIMSFQFEPRTPGKGTCIFDSVKVIKIGKE